MMSNALVDVRERIFDAGGGETAFRKELPFLFRQAIDELIDAPRTRRLRLDQLEPNEKAVLGIKVEAALRYFLDFPRGQLDFRIGPHDVDVKFTMRDNWMIPPEAVGHICLLCRVSETAARYWIGLLEASPGNLTARPNRDGKLSVSASGKQNIFWIAENEPFPPNIWEALTEAEAQNIFEPPGGTERIVRLFERFTGQPIHRSTIHAVARQHDYMKRIRANQGARDHLHPRGVIVLNGSQDGPLLKLLGLSLGKDFVMPYRPRSQEALKAIQSKSRHAKKFRFRPDD
ncbi:NaeI family type II restriction endonuclease [Glycocaulis sp.]|uniref:NaeI family type II restriction endonuclease n=1 Tax=Glycocaulis sp. TaxID=1969725 RepID=UPI003F6F00DD